MTGKRKYEKPKIRAFEISTEHCLLGGSVRDLGYYDWGPTPVDRSGGISDLEDFDWLTEKL